VTFRDAVSDDLDDVLRLYRQLNRDDPAVEEMRAREVFDHILATPGLRILLLEVDGRVVATTYLNLVPNLTRGAAPYAVVENVVVDEAVRGTGLGKAIMRHTLDEAWAAGCYKVMLLTGSRSARTHGFYRACGRSPDDKTAYHVRRPAGR
jgi:GNAT superfamily N-acetyltransferase